MSENCLTQLQSSWNTLGKNDPYWAVLTEGKYHHSRNKKSFFDSGKHEIDGVLKHSLILKPHLKRNRALDFGCGVGRLTQALCLYFKHVDGVDIADTMVKLAKRNNAFRNRCFYHLNSFPNLALFKDESFDFIYSAITLQHIKPIFSRQYIKEFIRVLKPDGLLVFHIPSSPSFTLKGITIRLIPTFILNHNRHMEMHAIKKRAIIDLIENAGATILDINPTNQSGSGWQSYIYWVSRGD